MDVSADKKKPIQLRAKGQHQVIDMDLLILPDKHLLINEDLGITTTLPRAFFTYKKPERKPLQRGPSNVINFAKAKARRELEQEIRQYEKAMGDYIHAT